MLFNFAYTSLKKKDSKNIKYQQASQSHNILLQRQNSFLGSNPIARRFHWVLLTWFFLISGNELIINWTVQKVLTKHRECTVYKGGELMI